MKRTLAEWLVWQESLNPAEIELKLERVKAVLDALDVARPPLVISVAGTNGKGSSVATLEQVFRADGAVTGTYTSPHIWHYNERIQVAGKPVNDDEIIAAFESIEQCRGTVPLTFFEYGTLAAWVVFAQSAVDVAVLEVGLGGRLDAVNAIDADAVLITSIGLDHQAWLGDTREAIGREKAGIMRAARPAVFSGSDIPESIAEYADTIGARLVVAGTDYEVDRQTDRWTWRSAKRTLENLPLPALPGAHQIDNAAGVIALLEALDRSELLYSELLADALLSVRVTGRLQQLGEAPNVIVDVAHNPQAAAELGRFLESNPVTGKTWAICAMLKDKDVAATLEPLLATVDHWFAAGIAGQRGLTGVAMAQIIAQTANRSCHVSPDIDAALSAALAVVGPEDRLLVFGSFYIAGPAIDRLAI